MAVLRVTGYTTILSSVVHIISYRLTAVLYMMSASSRHDRLLMSTVIMIWYSHRAAATTASTSCSRVYRCWVYRLKCSLWVVSSKASISRAYSAITATVMMWTRRCEGWWCRRGRLMVRQRGSSHRSSMLPVFPTINLLMKKSKTMINVKHSYKFIKHPNMNS